MKSTAGGWRGSRKGGIMLSVGECVVWEKEFCRKKLESKILI